MPTMGGSDQLVVHHRDGLGMTGPNATGAENLEVLCRRCHRDVHALELEHAAERAGHHWPPQRLTVGHTVAHVPHGVSWRAP